MFIKVKKTLFKKLKNFVFKVFITVPKEANCFLSLKMGKLSSSIYYSSVTLIKITRFKKKNWFTKYSLQFIHTKKW